MIDKTGKKILPKGETTDKDFLLAETKFLMKGFLRYKDDKKALIIAQNIHKYLRAKGSTVYISEMLSELENYTSQTQSDTFVWELVYIRRCIASSMGFSPSAMMFSASHRNESAKHFETICKLNPSVHNLCCRVLEYIFTADDLQTSKKTDRETLKKTEALISYAKSRFLEIEKNDSSIYFLSGKYVYLIESVHLQNIRASKSEYFETLKNSVYYCRELYKSECTVDNLKSLASYYIDYMSEDGFSYIEEMDNLKQLIEWMEESDSSYNTDFKQMLEHLKTIYERHRLKAQCFQ